MLGLYQQTSTFGFAMGLPVFAWEVSIAVWMIAKGFTPSPITASIRPPIRADWTTAVA